MKGKKDMDSIIAYLKKNSLLVIIILLGCLSAFAILNALPIITAPDASKMWIKQLAFYGISFVIIFIIQKVGNDQIYDKIKLFYIILMVFILGLTIHHFGVTRFGVKLVPYASTIKGSTLWYNFPGFSFQPIEFMKIVIVIMLAEKAKIYNEQTLIKTFESDLHYIGESLLVLLPPAILTYLQNDMGVVLIALFGVAFVIFSSGLKSTWFIVGGGFILLVLLIGTYIFIYRPDIFSKIFTGHKLARFYGWVDPEGTMGEEGYQLFYSLLSYGTAGWTGHGFQAVVKAFPEPQTDFIFAVIATNYGFIGASITIALIVALDVSILKIGLETTNYRDKYFAMGIFGMLFFQQVWNIGMILGIFPITGITLPFISYGGSSLLSYMIAIGMLVDINNQSQLLKNKQITD